MVIGGGVAIVCFVFVQKRLAFRYTGLSSSFSRCAPMGVKVLKLPSGLLTLTGRNVADDCGIAFRVENFESL